MLLEVDVQSTPSVEYTFKLSPLGLDTYKTWLPPTRVTVLDVGVVQDTKFLFRSPTFKYPEKVYLEAVPRVQEFITERDCAWRAEMCPIPVERGVIPEANSCGSKSSVTGGGTPTMRSLRSDVSFVYCAWVWANDSKRAKGKSI
jgi:hypothetical protein